MPPPPKQPHPDTLSLGRHMSTLKLPFMLEHHQAYAQSAADKHWSHLDYLSELINGEAAARDDRRVQRCINLARFPVLKTLDQFDWNWPTSPSTSSAPTACSRSSATATSAVPP